MLFRSLVGALPLVSVILGTVLAYIFGRRSKKDESSTRFKEEKYSKLLVKLQGFVGGTTSTQLKREFFEEQYQSWLYASDEVVEAINRMVELVIAGEGRAPDPVAGREAIGNIVLAMRRDLMRGSKLTYSSFRYTDVIDSQK